MKVQILLRKREKSFEKKYKPEKYYGFVFKEISKEKVTKEILKLNERRIFKKRYNQWSGLMPPFDDQYHFRWMNWNMPQGYRPYWN